MPQLAAPEYHYYRAPYPILSFIAGLYSDKYWSDEEFKKWKAGGEVNHKYVYDRYLDPYRTMPTKIQQLISQVVPEDESNIEDSEGRRAPNERNCEVLWPELLKELALPIQPDSGGRAPLFFNQKPIIGTLAAIYLGDEVAVKQALAYWERAKDDATRTKFLRVLEVQGTPAVAAALEPLKDTLFKDLTAPPNCW